jgi:hypothetical protein
VIDKNALAFLEMAAAGCVSGQVVEWPQLKSACRFGAEAIKDNELLRGEIRKHKERLRVIRDSMSLEQWQAFECDHPDASCWFGSDWEPV